MESSLLSLVVFTTGISRTSQSFMMKQLKHVIKYYFLKMLILQELAIERSVRTIQETWGTMSFSVTRHQRGTPPRLEDRGYTLNPCDEIIVKLDEDSMTLQSMAASQYVMCFL